MFYTTDGAFASLIVYMVVLYMLYSQVADVLVISRDKMALKQWTEAAVLGDSEYDLEANVRSAGLEESPKYIMGYQLRLSNGTILEPSRDLIYANIDATVSL